MVGDTMLIEVIDTPVIEWGHALIAELRSKMKISAAFWVVLADDYRRQLYIVTPDIDSRGPKKFFEILHKVIDRMDGSSEIASNLRRTRFAFISPSDPIYQTIKHGQPYKEAFSAFMLGTAYGDVGVVDAYLY